MAFKTINNFMGFPYLVAVRVPVRKTKSGDVIDLDPSVLEKAAAAAIISHIVPLHGKEVRFLRKVAGLSCEKFSREFGLSASTVLRWEQSQDDRLTLPNEVAVRMFFAERFKLTLPSAFSELIGKGQVEQIELKIA
jgi:DNA-binding transcriptional regulator YiaG